MVVAHLGAVAVEELVPAEPHLTGVVRHVLARVLADRAGARRRAAGGYCVPHVAQRYVTRISPDISVAFEQRDALDVRRVREHVDRPGADEPVAVVVAEPLQVAARASSGCTRRRRSRGAAISPRRLQRLARKAGARRVDDDHVGLAGAVAQVAQHLADVPGEERGVADRVQLLRSRSRRRSTPREISIPHTVSAATRARGRSCRCRSRGRRRSRSPVSARTRARSPYSSVGHLGVRLQERVRPHAEAEAADLLLDRVLAPEELGRQVRHLGDARVLGPVDRAHLRGTRSAPRSGARGRSARRAAVTSCTSAWPVLRPSRTTRWRR